jgi:hypothetical protein
MLGLSEVASLLDETLEKEKAADTLKPDGLNSVILLFRRRNGGVARRKSTPQSDQ